MKTWFDKNISKFLTKICYLAHVYQKKASIDSEATQGSSFITAEDIHSSHFFYHSRLFCDSILDIQQMEMNNITHNRGTP